MQTQSQNQIPTLITKRLILRPFTLDDAPDVQRLAGAPEIANTTLLIPHPYPDGAAEEWINTHAAAFAENKNANFAITLKATKELIGAIGLTFNQSDNNAEMGYWVGHPYWNHGYCTEAAREILRHGFIDRKLKRIHAHHFGSNPASGKVMLKLGMKYEGTLRKHIRKNDRFEDAVMYGILQTDFE